MHTVNDIRQMVGHTAGPHLSTRPNHHSHCRSCSHVSDRVRIQFTASEWPLKVSTCSIVPSGHSASTDHFSPSRSTTQKTGFTIVNPTTGRPANNHYGALQQICGWSGDAQFKR